MGEPRLRRHRLKWAFLPLALGSSPALAAPEEIQVYMDELNDPGEVGLDIHNNYVISGSPGVDYGGEQPSLHRYRVTPEFSLGLTRSLELGAYLPLATIDRRGMFVDGVKFRLKWLAPRATGQHWFWGLNFELGREGHRLNENPYNAELKGIGGVRQGRWTAAANLNFDFKVSGPRPSPATLELATKFSFALSGKTAVGVENYNGLGEVRALTPFAHSGQSTYVAVDTSIGKWDLNLGIGRGYGSNPDKWIAKAIVGVPLDMFKGH